MTSPYKGQTSTEGGRVSTPSFGVMTSTAWGGCPSRVLRGRGRTHPAGGTCAFLACVRMTITPPRFSKASELMNPKHPGSICDGLFITDTLLESM